MVITIREENHRWKTPVGTSNGNLESGGSARGRRQLLEASAPGSKGPATLRLVELVVMSAILPLYACGVASGVYNVTKGTVRTTYHLAKAVVKIGVGTTKVVYRIGKFTFEVVKAPISWPLVHDEIETIDSISPKEAIRQGRVKTAPYVVKGQRYVPMSVTKAKHYQEEGIASWYGYETRRQQGGHMTANGEAFDPLGFTAAHKYLPLPTFVRITNLENRRSLIGRVNDRGPFVSERIIDLSAGAARELGFYQQGLARVRIETVELEG